MSYPNVDHARPTVVRCLVVVEPLHFLLQRYARFKRIVPRQRHAGANFFAVNLQTSRMVEVKFAQKECDFDPSKTFRSFIQMAKR